MTSRTGNLPAPLTTFVGRGREAVEVRRLLRTARLLMLTGVGGVGKTRLALEVAAASVKAFPDGVWLVDLASVGDPQEVASSVARVLDVPDQGTGPLSDQLAAHLSGYRALIVLDNCEHLITERARLAWQLLSAAGGLRIMATSRHTLGLIGEYVFVVPPLPPADAAALLLDRAEARDAGHRISAAGPDAVAGLCAGLDGIPLAIELAASRLRTLTVEQVTERLENRFALLSYGSTAASKRHRSLQAMIDSSYELCAPAEQLLWQRVSVFAGPFSLDAAEEVCRGARIPRTETLDLLDRLIAQSVVLPTVTEGRSCYRLLESIREFGRERLAGSGEEERLLGRHLDFYLARAEDVAARWWGPGQEETLAWLRAEHDNLLAALEYGRRLWTPSAGPDEVKPRTGAADPDGPGSLDGGPGTAHAWLDLVTALRFHWCCNGFLGEGRRQFDRVLRADTAPTPARARALWAASWVAMMQGDHATVDRWLDEAEELAEQLDDPLVGAYVKGIRGSSALYRGQPRQAAQLLRLALATRTALGQGPTRLQFLFQLALAQLYLGDPGAAETARCAVAAAEAHGERLSRSYALWTLGYDAWLRGKPEESHALMLASLEIQQGFSDHAGVAGTLEVLAWSTAALGDHRQAARLLGALRPLTRELHGTSGGPFADDHARCEQAIVKALGPAAYERAFAEGTGCDTPHRAVALALGTAPGRGARIAAATSSSPLSSREQEVAALVAKGMSNKQIATVLGRSQRTVDTHVQKILAKLVFGSRAQIATWWTANQPPAP
ncbi:LuxR C-terminal-related transcriptional regulator [Streptomyces humi]